MRLPEYCPHENCEVIPEGDYDQEQGAKTSEYSSTVLGHILRGDRTILDRAVLEPHSYDDMICTVCGFYGDETQDSLVLSDYVQMDHPAILSAVEVARGNRIVLESDGYSPLSR